MTRRLTFVFTLFLTALFVICLSPYRHTSEAQVCGDQLAHCGGDDYPECSNHGFTSLPAIDIHRAGDWYVDAGHENDMCGEKSCFWFFHEFRCACGEPYSGRLCTAAEKRRY